MIGPEGIPRPRRKKPPEETVEFPVAPMLDMSFQLLAFFILTFQAPSGETRIDLQTNAAILADYAQNLFLGLGLDGTERRLAAASRLSLDEVREAAKRHLTGEVFTTAVLRGKS